MKDLINKMDQIQGVQTTGLPSTSNTQSGHKLLNERNQNIDEIIAPMVKGAINLGGKAIGATLRGAEKVGNAVVQGTKGAVGGLTGKAPAATTATKTASNLDPKKVSFGPKRSNIKTATTTAPARTGSQKAGDVAAKVGKTALGAATIGGLGYAGKKAYDALTKDDNKPEPAPGPAPGPKPPSPAPKPPVVGPTTDTPTDDVDPRIDPYKPDTSVTTDIPNMQKPVDNNALAPYEKQNTAAPASAGGYAQSATAADNDNLDKGSSSYTGPIGNADNDPKPAATSTVPEQPKGIVTTRDGSPLTDRSGNPVKTRAGAEADLDAKYNGSNTRTDDDGRTYVRQKGVMGAPDSEQRSYASFGDFFNKIRGKGDVNGRMDEEVEQLLDAIIEAQEIDRITSLSGISEAKLPPGYYDDDPTIPRSGWKQDDKFKFPTSPYKIDKASSAGYGRYGKNTADLQKFINQLGYKDKKGNPLSLDARYGPQTANALHALKNKFDPNSAEYKTLRSFDAAVMAGDKDSRIQGPMKKVTPNKPADTSTIPAPSNTTEPKPSPMNADSLRAKLDAASGLGKSADKAVTPASTSAMPNSDDSGQPVLKTADEWQKDKDARQPKSFQQMGMVGQDFEESVMREAIEIARIANLSGIEISEAKMKDLVSKKVKGSYGTEYQGDEDEDDTNDKKAKDGEKKKRGGQFKGDKDTSGKEKFSGADAAMAAMGVGKAKKSKELDKLPAKKHSLKEYFDETEAMIIAEAQHAGIMDEVADAMFQLETALLESVMGGLNEQQCLEHICECYPHEVKLFIDTGNLDPDLFHELSDHYKRHARVPHRIARERDVTPLFDLVKGLFEGDIGMNAEVTQAPEPMEVDEGIEDTLQNILPKSMQPFNNDTAAAASRAQAPVKKVREATKPW